MFQPIFIPDKHTHELSINKIPMSKKLIFLRFIHLFMFQQKLGEVGEKQTIMSLSM